jgi:hypothetical protein
MKLCFLMSFSRKVLAMTKTDPTNSKTEAANSTQPGSCHTIVEPLICVKGDTPPVHRFYIATSMFFLGPITAILLAASGNDKSFLELRLSMSYDYETEAKEFVEKGQYKDAVPLYAQAIDMGRKPALALHEEQQQGETTTSKSTSSSSLEWLLQLYCSSCRTRLKVDDVQGARGEAWAACVFSQNKNVDCLQCMLQVCEASGDALGQMQTLQQLLELTTTRTSTAGDDEQADKRQEMVAKLAELKLELANQFGKE